MMAGPDLTIDTDRRSRLKLADQIDVLTMAPAARRRLLRDIGKESRQRMRSNIQHQKTVAGSPMPPRADRKKRKMFRRLAKGMVTNIVNDHEADVTWKYGSRAKLAYRHHHGITQEVSAGEAARVAHKRYGSPPKYKNKATKAQAKALNREGFRRRVARKRGKGGAVLKRVPQKWIRDNMSIGQAGLVLRLMRTGTPKGVQRWQINVPERPVLGATPADADKILTAMAANALQRIKRT